jgi:hypothetical protein
VVAIYVLDLCFEVSSEMNRISRRATRDNCFIVSLLLCAWFSRTLAVFSELWGRVISSADFTGFGAHFAKHPLTDRRRRLLR